MTDVLKRLTDALGDRYQVDRELGGGGMSRVFVATETALAREVVVKVISPDVMADAGAERFAREVKLAARLQHTNIVPVLTAGDAHGLAYYTMPLVRGESLRVRLQRGAVPSGEARTILRDIVRALAYAHEEGIVHRDIKPENVLLSGDAALVADFGIAKAIASSKTVAPGGTLTQAGASLGTPAYMAPEQAVGDDVDGRADLYAWGVIAYELLAGRHPFHDRKTAQQLIAAHIADRPSPLLELLPPEQRRDSALRSLAVLVMQCLEKQPSARPASAREVLAALDAPVAVPASMPSPGVLVGAVVLMLGIAVAAWYVISLRSAAPTTALLEPKRVVVATFENKSGDASLTPLGVMAADWIARGLIGTGLVDVGGTSADLEARGVLSSTEAGESPIQSLARNANAGLVISGAFYKQGDSVLFQADFTDANTRKLIQTVGPIAALTSAPLTGVERLRQRVIGSLAPLVDSTLASYATQTGQPPSLEAYRELLAGEELFYRDDLAALVHYERAAAADSTYTLPLLRAMLVFSNQGDQRRYDSLAAVLARRRDQLSPFEQAYLDYVACNGILGRPRCVLATREMVRLTPKSQFAAYLHAITLRWDNQPRAADSVLRRLDPRSGEVRGRIYLVHHHSGVLHRLGEHERELGVVEEAQRQYPGRLFLSHTRLSVLIALARMSDFQKALDETLRMPRDIRSSPLQVGALALYELRWHGYAATADSLGLRLLAMLDSLSPADAHSTVGRQDRAEVLMATHQWARLAAFADTLLRDDPESIFALRMGGTALGMLGRRAAAEAMDRRLANGTRPVRTADGCQSAFRGCRNVARTFIAAALGDKERAVSLMHMPYFQDRFAHYEFLGEMLGDFPPFVEFIKPRG